MPHFWLAIVLGVLQGVSELFPVSSLAQTILLPALLEKKWPAWHIDHESGDFLAFVVALHLATAIALLLYFWKDWKVVFAAYAGSVRHKKLVYDRDSKFAWMLVAGTIFVGVVGLVLEKHLRKLFDKPQHAWIVAVVLILNGFMMMFADVLKRAAEKKAALAGTGAGKDAEDLTMTQAAAVGATQTLALVPGISRSGVTIAAGLGAGLSYEQASRFSFMLATPIIGLAALYKVKDLFHHGSHDFVTIVLPSAIVAGITAYLSTAFLMRYFRHNRLSPFGWYCVAFGALCLFALK